MKLEITAPDIKKLQKAYKDLNNTTLNCWTTKTKFDNTIKEMAGKYNVDTQIIFDAIPIMKRVATGNGYDYYISIDAAKATNGKFYNIVPENSPAPKGGYSKEWILGVKKVPDLFN